MTGAQYLKFMIFDLHDRANFLSNQEEKKLEWIASSLNPLRGTANMKIRCLQIDIPDQEAG